MYINVVSHYLPKTVVDNDYFGELNGLTADWIVERTGIRERRKASQEENTNTMAIKAVEKGVEQLPFPVESIDLIVGASYTPHDTIVTLAHAVQHYLQIDDIPVTSVSSACSSLLNAVEVVEGYFALNKAKHALVVLAEHNTLYNNERDTVSGHLWGDGAAALFISKEKFQETDLKIKDIKTGGAATAGRGTEGVVLKPFKEGIAMPYGRDVFINACEYMPKVTKQVLDRNNLGLDQLSYLIPHQANLRITKNVANRLKLAPNKALSNIEYLGNTGCAGCAIALSEHKDRFKKGDNIVVVVFGGGYSYGAMLLEN
ncbi:3-oxoacyl-ACP synthase III family protein [Xanthovirga aplysinae]|uniref:3-oxoacyl-ACP synthase III family protein n=1 Tax=Xanthovirga aplysinae TaxID=2529853 RepID=UPI0012BC2C32|nr:ketoacyl-ACP synthase III [Xanthovirga aplysinae]MTI30658.1 ketoacyl-ACP synthase III [Xanthovirga aplysinae]